MTEDMTRVPKINLEIGHDEKHVKTKIKYEKFEDTPDTGRSTIRSEYDGDNETLEKRESGYDGDDESVKITAKTIQFDYTQLNSDDETSDSDNCSDSDSSSIDSENESVGIQLSSNASIDSEKFEAIKSIVSEDDEFDE